MSGRIAITCLSCGHRCSVSEEDLPAFGLEPNASLVTLTKRLVCKECGSRSVRTQRILAEPDGPSIVPPDILKKS
jgi:RNase P subunit RPR2